MRITTCAICRNRYFQCNSLSASCSWRENGVACIFNHTGILGISPSPSERLLSIPASRSRHCVPVRYRHARNNANNNNKQQQTSPL